MRSHLPVTLCFHETGLPKLFHEIANPVCYAELAGSVKQGLGIKKESIPIDTPSFNFLYSFAQHKVQLRLQ